MSRWYVGRERNRSHTWEQSYRRLLRTVEFVGAGSAVRALRRSRDYGGTHLLVMDVEASTEAEAVALATEVFDRADERFGVGFGKISSFGRNAQGGFLEPTEYPTDGRIPVAPPHAEDVTDRDAAETADFVPPTAAGAIDPASDNLLRWLTAAGEGRWEAFVRVARLLGAAADAPAARQLFRRFVLLGHLEGSPDGQAWAMAPPVAVRVADHFACAFWCGSRCADLERNLPASWEAAAPVGQPDGWGPSRVGWSVTDVTAWRDTSPLGKVPSWHAVVYGGRVAELLGQRLPDLCDWQRMLHPAGKLVAPERVERWNPKTSAFDTEPTFRVTPTGLVGPEGLYQLTFGEEPRTFTLTAYFDPARPTGEQMLRGDWYGLRFLALSRSGRYLKAVWRAQDGGALGVSNRQRWPLLYERALVLASGLLPQRDGNGWLWYRGVPLQLAAALAKRLGVEIETGNDPAQPGGRPAMELSSCPT